MLETTVTLNFDLVPKYTNAESVVKICPILFKHTVLTTFGVHRLRLTNSQKHNASRHATFGGGIKTADVCKKSKSTTIKHSAYSTISQVHSFL